MLVALADLVAPVASADLADAEVEAAVDASAVKAPAEKGPAERVPAVKALVNVASEGNGVNVASGLIDRLGRPSKNKNVFRFQNRVRHAAPSLKKPTLAPEMDCLL